MKDLLYRSIEDRFGFSIPLDYRRLEARGLLTLGTPSHAASFAELGTYLWLPDMEWYSLEDIAAFQFQSYHLPGFVPFAFTGGGDYWCWQSSHARVVCCHRDCERATVYAPDFASALYRQALSICEDTDLDSPRFLMRWASDLADVIPAVWCARLVELAQRSDRSTVAFDFERSDLVFGELDTEIQWMVPS